MQNKKRVLGLGLQQIIKTDHMANQIIQEAMDKRAQLEAKTEQDKQAILQDAQKQYDEMSRQVLQQEQDQRQKQEQEAMQQMQQQCNRLQALVQQNQKQWVQEIVNNILQK